MTEAIPYVSRVTLIRVEHVIGRGVEDDPVRSVVDYFNEDGTFFMRQDDWADSQPEATKP